MKKVSKTLAIVLCLVMILSITALASWYTYGGSNSHNHVVTDAPLPSPPANTDPPADPIMPTISEIELLNAGGGWDGVDTEPLMRTVGSTTYAYILYDGHKDGGRLVKINCSDSTPSIVWDRQISGSNGFQLSTPLLVPGTTEANDTIYLASSFAEIVSGVSLSSDVSIPSGSTVTLSWTNLTISTTTNRLAIGILLGEYSTQQTNFSANGSASLSLTGGNPVSITLNPSNPATGTNYHPVEVVVHDPVNNTDLYQYWWYINQNISGTTGTGKTASAVITLSNHSGTAKTAEMYAQHSAVQKVTKLNSTAAKDVDVKTIKDNVPGQINTPITTDGTYIYFGTYTGYSTAGTYYQLNLTPVVQNGVTTYPCKSWTTSGYGFYWAGAACDTNNVYFGSDNGMLYWRSRDYFDMLGGSLNLKDTSIGGATDAGNVRSTIMIDDGKLYFTSQGGYLWCCSYNTSTYSLVIEWKIALRNTGNTANVTCTSTPTKVGNRIYVGCYGGNGKSGVKCITITKDQNNNDVIQEGYVIQDNSLVVQCSIVVKSTTTNDGFLDYLYFCTNAAAGKGYCYSWDGTTATLIWDSTTATPTWSDPNHTVDCTYALGGMAIENGIAICGNDHNYVYIVK